MSWITTALEWSKIRRGDQLALANEAELGFGWPVTAWYIRLNPLDSKPWVQLGAARQYSHSMRVVKYHRESNGAVFAPESWAPQLLEDGVAKVVLSGDMTTVTGSSFRRLCLPLRPFAAGLFLDSVIAGLLVAVLWGISREIFSQVRRVRGRCPKCGYDMAGLPTGVCPECGHGVAALQTVKKTVGGP